MVYVIAYLDKQGNHRDPASWDEVKGMYCKRWDSCEPCVNYIMRKCQHPLHPSNTNQSGGNK